MEENQEGKTEEEVQPEIPKEEKPTEAIPPIKETPSQEEPRQEESPLVEEPIPQEKPIEETPLKVEPPPVGVFQPPSPFPKTLSPSELRERSKIVRSQKVEKKLGKILELARKQGEIRVRDLKLKLHFPESTATRYLRILLQRGLLKRTGRGPATRYLMV